MPTKSKKVDPLSGWREHVRKFREKNPEMSFKMALQKAKASYKKISDCECGGKCGNCK